jgi:hypothetical protein
MSTTGSSYLFNQGREQERVRLAGLSAQFDPVTVRHLATVGIAAGWRCLEVGPGTGGVAQWLAATVGGTGRVVATTSTPSSSTIFRVPCRGGAARHHR